MRLPRYPVYRVMADCRYAGMWFRVDGDDLYVTGHTDRLTDALRLGVKRHKPAIIEALRELPSGCRVPTACLNVGCGGHCEHARPQQEGRDAA